MIVIEKGIDISFWQEKADFNKIKKDGIDFVIFREGKKTEIDTCFLTFVKGAKEANLDIKGVYHFCYSVNEKEALEQAKSCIKNVQKANLDKNKIIVFFDFEYDTVTKAKKKGITLTKKDCINFTKIFCEYVTLQGYKAGIYANKDYYLHMYDKDLIDKYIFWLAEPEKETPSYPCDFFQYSFKGKVNGVSGDIDMNIYFKKQEVKGGNQKQSMSIDFTKYYGKISNSSGDQNGHIHGGAAGDQTGKEWQIRSWYNRPWTCILRYPDQEVRELIAELGIQAANNDKIGYDQYQRDTYWTQLKNSGYRPSKITKACEADCSAGVIANTKAAGYLKNITALKNLSASYTGNMRTGYKKAGFTVLTDKKYLTGYDYLVPGDILLYDNHHTATNLSIGKKAGYIPLTDKKTTVTITEPKTQLNKTPKKTGVVTAGSLYVRTWAGQENDPLKSIPVINKNTEVEICDEVKDSKGKIWYYVRINKKTYGFVSSTYIKVK